jgi:hypothetical protein
MKIGFAGNLEKEGIAEYRVRLMEQASALGEKTVALDSVTALYCRAARTGSFSRYRRRWNVAALCLRCGAVGYPAAWRQPWANRVLSEIALNGVL